MLRVHGNERDEAQLEPGPGLCGEHCGVMAPGTYSGCVIPYRLDFGRAADHDGYTKKKIHHR